MRFEFGKEGPKLAMNVAPSFTCDESDRSCVVDRRSLEARTLLWQNPRTVSFGGLA